MPVLKSTSSTATEVFSLRDIEQQGAAILARARRQAESLLAEAQREAELLRQRAHERGLTEGKSKGIELGKAEGAAAGKQQALAEHKAQLTTLIESLAAAASQIEQSRHELLDAANVDVARLAVAIARKIVHRVAAEPAVVSETLARAMKFVVGQNDVKIVVHSSQRSLLLDALPALQIRWPGLKHVEIAADDSVAPGGAKILTQHGYVDATLDAMVDRIAAELIGQPQTIAEPTAVQSGPS